MSQSNNRRVIEPHSSSPRLTGEGIGPWASGLWSGLQALVLSFFLVVLPVVAGYVATSGNAANDGVGWVEAVNVGVEVWLLGHGGTIATSIATFTIVPLGLMMAILAINWASVRRTAAPQIEAGIAHTISYVVAVALLGLMLGPASRGGMLRVLLGALLLAGGAAILGIRRVRRDADKAGLVPAFTATLEPLVRWTESVGKAVPQWLFAALRAAVVAVASLLAAGALLVIVWLIASRGTVAALMLDLHADPIGAVALILGQLFLLPNLVVWCGAWVIGTGFSVGSGTIWSPFEVVTAPLPAIPVLGVLPQSTGSALAGPWVIALPILAGALAGWYLYRVMIVPVLTRVRAVAASSAEGNSPKTRSTRAPEFPRWHESLGAALTSAVISGLIIFVLCAISGGVSGPGRLAEVGAQSLITASIFAGEVLVGALLVTVMTRPEVTRTVRRWLTRG